MNDRGIISDLKYDITAIKKYGLINHLKYLFDLKHVIIKQHFDLDYCPPFLPKKEFIVKEISIKDRSLMEEWCDIINTAFAFKTPYDYESGLKYINNHPYKVIKKIFLIYNNDKPIATISIGHYRANQNVACAARLAVKKNMQGKGLGKYLVLFSIEEMRKLGYKYYEETFNFKRDYSIKLYIKCGGFPQFNQSLLVFKPTRKSKLITLYAHYKVNKFYKEHLNEISNNLFNQ